MKKTCIIFLALLLTVISLNLPATVHAEERSNMIVEYLDDGSYFITEIIDESIARASTKTATKRTTYVTSTGVSIWQLSVTGTFSYEYGISSRATNSVANLEFFSTNATKDVLNAYYVGSDAYGYASVYYIDRFTYKELKLTCDKYGNIT